MDKVKRTEMMEELGITPKMIYDAWILFHDLLHDTKMEFGHSITEWKREVHPGIVSYFLLTGMSEMDQFFVNLIKEGKL